jgi:hypothetical protein
LRSRTFRHQRQLRKNLFGWCVDERRCELRRLLYSKREKPVSSKNKKIVSRNCRTSVVENITRSDGRRAQTEEVKREVAIK